MLLTSSAPETTLTVLVDNKEGTPSPKEISRRILEVRASWDVKERVRRRHQARARFSELMSNLAGAQAQ